MPWTRSDAEAGGKGGGEDANGDVVPHDYRVRISVIESLKHGRGERPPL